MFQFTCPGVETQPEILRVCKLRSCQSTRVIIHQRFKKQVKDSVLDEVEIIRLKCKTCKYSFRIYPEGIKDYSLRTKRLIFLGIVLYSAGLSYVKSAGFLNGMLGRNLESFITIWRDVQTIGENLRRSHLPQFRTIRTKSEFSNIAKVVVGLDGTYVKVGGKSQPLIVATNVVDGTLITVELGDEWREKELKAFFKEVTKLLGIKNIAGLTSDDLDTYKVVSRYYKLPHQVCLAHVKKNLTKRLNKLSKLNRSVPKGYIEKLASILDPPQKENDQVLKDLLKDPKLWRSGKRNLHWVTYRNIVTDLLRNWDRYIAYLAHPEANLVTTNNKTEQSIGRSKVRYKLTRGFKSKGGVLNFFYLTQYTGMHKFQEIALAI